MWARDFVGLSLVILCGRVAAKFWERIQQKNCYHPNHMGSHWIENMVLPPITGLGSPTTCFLCNRVIFYFHDYGKKDMDGNKKLETFDHLTCGWSLECHCFLVGGSEKIKLVLWGFAISDMVPGRRLFLAFILLLGRFVGSRGR